MNPYRGGHMHTGGCGAKLLWLPVGRDGMPEYSLITDLNIDIVLEITFDYF